MYYFNGRVIFHCAYVPQLSYPFIGRWTPSALEGEVLPLDNEGSPRWKTSEGWRGRETEWAGSLWCMLDTYERRSEGRKSLIWQHSPKNAVTCSRSITCRGNGSALKSSTVLLSGNILGNFGECFKINTEVRPPELSPTAVLLRTKPCPPHSTLAW